MDEFDLSENRIPAELQEKAEAACRKIIEQNGVCRGVLCSRCIGCDDYNEDIHCNANGFAGVNTIAEEDHVAVKNATEWLEKFGTKEKKVEEFDLKTPRIIAEDVKVWVWHNDTDDAAQQYLLAIRENGVFIAWDFGKTAKENDFIFPHSTAWKNASMTDPRTPKKKTRPYTHEEIFCELCGNVIFRSKNGIMYSDWSTAKDNTICEFCWKQDMAAGNPIWRKLEKEVTE